MRSPAFAVLTAIAAAVVSAGCAASRPPSVEPARPVGAADGAEGAAESVDGAPERASGGDGERMSESSPRRPSAQDAARLETLYMARVESAASEHHPADARFMVGMIAHHAQALTMTGFAPTAGGSESIRTLCARIFVSQRDEIQLMQSWLADRGLDAPTVDLETGEVEAGHYHGHHAERAAAHALHAPGMLSDWQMEQLGRAKGGEYDRLLLEYMIMHHEGAVTMVEELFATDGAALDDTVFRLASDIQVDQLSEISRMKAMLEALDSR